MENKDIETFDPTIAELNALVESTKGINASDLEDKAQLVIVTENRIALKKARVKIEKRGKELREEATAFNRKVIAKEKELIGIIEPEEERLAAIEQEAKLLEIKKSRMEKYPAREARIHALGFTVTDESDLNDMDDVQFEDHFNKLVAIKNENDRLEAEKKNREEAERIEKERQEAQEKINAENTRIKAEQDAKEAELNAKQKVIDDENARIQREKEIKEAEERARKEAEIKAEQDAKEKEQKRIENEKAESDKKELQRLQELEDERIGNEKRQKSQKYQKMLSSYGYTSETKDDYKIELIDGVYTIWKKLGSEKE